MRTIMRWLPGGDPSGLCPWRVRFRLPALLVVFAALASSAVACTIPVYRYAADSWLPDPYRIHLFHDAPLTDAQQALVRQLEAPSQPANVTILRHLTTDPLSGEPAALLKAFPADRFPHMMLQLPQTAGDPRPIWTGAFDQHNVQLLHDSPIRSRLVHELADGNAIVWLYLQCGDEARDKKVFSMLTDELRELESSLELPALTEEDRQALDGDLTLRLSAVSISRNDPAEAALVQMLLSVEPDLRDPPFADQPMAMPVFGRGRVLYSLVGDGIQPQMIKEACQFLTGACQCTVKVQNPGTDLLLAANWKRSRQPAEPLPAEPQYVAIPGSPAESGSAVSTDIVPATPMAATAAAGSALTPGLLLMMASLGLAVVAVAGWLLRGH